jgi:hypothetical protein
MSILEQAYAIVAAAAITTRLEEESEPVPAFNFDLRFLPPEFEDL